MVLLQWGALWVATTRTSSTLLTRPMIRVGGAMIGAKLTGLMTIGLTMTTSNGAMFNMLNLKFHLTMLPLLLMILNFKIHFKLNEKQKDLHFKLNAPGQKPSVQLLLCVETVVLAKLEQLVTESALFVGAVRTSLENVQIVYTLPTRAKARESSTTTLSGRMRSSTTWRARGSQRESSRGSPTTCWTFMPCGKVRGSQRHLRRALLSTPTWLTICMAWSCASLWKLSQRQQPACRPT